uniref:Uncharacterized protein n=1 Tax=Nelumbo nucifera TaxID=4432 RepID=A0A823A5V0_NELNU|nr:TPA_asm: hypothetical protein HUJ06_019095 [Nelumbo nucifera]
MCDPPEDPSSSQDLLGFTPEEVGKLEKELTKLLSRNPVPTGAESTEGEATHLPLDKFLNCPSSLEVDRTICQRFCHDLDDRDDDHPGCSSSVVSKGKDVNLEGNTAIRRRSISFLLKKIFVCRSGFTPIPSLRDQLPESKMEKLLKDMLHKRIYPRSSSTSSTKKYLENRQMLKTGNEDDGCKWVKTDSECKFFFMRC